MEKNKFEWKESLKKFKWKERLIYLAISYGIFGLMYLIIRDLPDEYLIEWAIRVWLVAYMIFTAIVLVPNFKIVALSFPIGFIVGLIFGSIFGKKVVNSYGEMGSTHGWEFIKASAVTTLIAIIAEIVFAVIKRSKTKLSKAVEERD